MSKKRVYDIAWKNQQIIDDGDKVIYFKSYDSIIASYNKYTDILKLSELWDYSNTTRKWLYIFLYDYVKNDIAKELKQEQYKKAFIQKLLDCGEIEYMSKKEQQKAYNIYYDVLLESLE